MNCKTAKQIDIIEFLIQLGHEPTIRKNHEVWFKSPLREEKTASFKVDSGKNFWYDFGEGIGGTLIDLVLNILKTNNVSKALQFIENNYSIALGRKKLFSFPKQIKKIPSQTSKRNIRFSQLNSSMLLSYLKKRGISYEFNRFLKQGIEMKAEKTYSYLAFENDKGGCELRNPYYKGCTHPKWVTTIKNNPTYPILVFEGFFDFLSAWEIAKRNQAAESTFMEQSNYLILNSIALLNRGIEVLKRYDEIRLFLDNDSAGIKSANKLISSFPKAKNYSKYYEGFEDLNEFLIKNESYFKIE